MGQVIAFPVPGRRTNAEKQRKKVKKQRKKVIAFPVPGRRTNAEKQRKIRELSRQIRAMKKAGIPFTFNPNDTPSAA